MSWAWARTGAAAAAVGLVAFVAVTVLPADAAPVRYADWRMNERPTDCTEMVDRSGFEHHGDIGGRVECRGDAYGFDDDGPPGLRHLVIVRDDGRDLLDPRAHDIVITLRVQHVGAGIQNVLQKGQSQDPGGFYKVEIDERYPACQFADQAGESARVVSRVPVPNDGEIHTVRCERRESHGDVRVSVDGQFTSRAADLGVIANEQDISIGGKVRCGSKPCDYFVGEIHNATIDIGE